MRRKKEIPLKTLQIQHKDATKKLILEWAMHLIVAEKETFFSHESVASAAGISARTVYRHFPTRDDLLSSLWAEFQAEEQGAFAQTEEELLQRTSELYRRFDRYEGLVRAYLSSGASHKGGETSVQTRQAIEHCLGRLMGAMDEEHHAQAISVFLALYSPQTWQIMRDGGGLSGPQAAKAAQFAMAAMMEALRPRPIRSPGVPDAANQRTLKPPQSNAPEVPVQAPAEGEISQPTGKWKGVYNNPVMARLKKFMPKD